MKDSTWSFFDYYSLSVFLPLTQKPQ